MIYCPPFNGIPIPEQNENPYEQTTAHLTAGELGSKINPHIDRYAEAVQLPRRRFLQTACGMAAAMLAVNKATGLKFFDVSEAAAANEDAASEQAEELRGANEFIVDVHSHVCWRQDGFVVGKNTTERGMIFVDGLDGLGKAFGLEGGIRDMNVDNFGKLVFDNSDTSIAVVNPFGFREDYGDEDMIPIDELAELRRRWPDRVVVLGGGLTPNQGLTQTLERLDMFIEDFQISGLKLYTFDATPQRGWWFDDEKLAYPIWERCRELGIRNIGCHKGIPFSHFSVRYAHPTDMDQAAEDFPDLNWMVFHSAYPYTTELVSLGKAFKSHRKNLYCELGSTFAVLVSNRPLECAHTLGRLLRDIGTDRVMWGTDSVLWGSPQWQIEAFRRFRIPDELIEGYGYPQLTDEVKRKILHENAQRLWDLPVPQVAG